MQPVAEVDAREVGARDDTELGEHVGQVMTHRAGTDQQLCPDLPVGEPPRGQPSDSRLLRREDGCGVPGRAESRRRCRPVSSSSAQVRASRGAASSRRKISAASARRRWQPPMLRSTGRRSRRCRPASGLHAIPELSDLARAPGVPAPVREARCRKGPEELELRLGHYLGIARHDSR